MVIRDDFVVTSPFPDIRIPDQVDIGSYLMRNFHNYPDRIALIDANTKQSYTFAQVEDLVNTIAANLLQHGYTANRPLTIFMVNSIEYLLLCLATWRLGGVVACINALLLEGEVKTELQMLKTEMLVCDDSTADRALNAAKGTTVKRIFCKGNHASCLPLTSLTSKHADTSRLPTHIRVNQHKDPCLILFSSGTTGLPKGVLLSHRNMIVSCRLYGGPEVDKLPKHHGVVYQPLSHVYGIALAMTYLYWGVSLIVMPKFNLEQYIKLIAEYRVDQLHLVPPIMVLLANSDLPRKYDLSCLRSISSGAAPLSEELERQVAKVVGPKCQIRQSWGMTETCSGVTTVPSSGVCRYRDLPIYQGTIGMVFPNTYMKVKDVDTGKSLGPNKTGELCVQSEQLMLGYLDNAQATERAIDYEGWLHTGDIGYYNTDGCFFVVDRLKELIKYKGYQVAPAELEAVLLSHPSVSDAGVVGLQDPVGGEVPLAWVVRKQGVTVTDTTLHEFVNSKVAPYKRLRGGIKFVEVIPKSPSGKILRREILKKELQSRSVKSKL